MSNIMFMKMWLMAKLNKFAHEEKGDVNIVSIVVLIGIAVVLAIIFKDAIVGLIQGMLNTIQTNADNALKMPE